MLHLCVALFRLLGKHAAVGLAALLLWISPARSALGAEPDKAAAMAHYEAGTRLYDIHEYDAALKEYKAGYLTRPDPSFLYNIGQCYKRLGMPVQAREFFREYLKKAARDDRNRAQAGARLRELETEADGTTNPPPASTARTAPVSDGDMSGAEQQPRNSSVKRSALPPAAGPTEPMATPAAGLDFSNSGTVPVEPSPTPYYRTWWFWTGVGAVVAASVVTAVVWPKNNGQLSVSGTTLGTRTVLQ